MNKIHVDFISQKPWILERMVTSIKLKCRSACSTYLDFSVIKRCYFITKNRKGEMYSRLKLKMLLVVKYDKDLQKFHLFVEKLYPSRICLFLAWNTGFFKKQHLYEVETSNELICHPNFLTTLIVEQQLTLCRHSMHYTTNCKCIRNFNHFFLTFIHLGDCFFIILKWVINDIILIFISWTLNFSNNFLT